GEEALSLKEKLKGDEVSSTAGSDKGVNAEKGSTKDKADKIAQLTRVITDEKAEGSKEVKVKFDNGDNAGIINKKTQAPVSTLDVKGSEKAETITQNVKEAAREGIKTERHLELSEGKADLSKVVSDKPNQDAETGAFKGKGKGEGDFSLSQEGAEGAPEADNDTSLKGVLKEAAFLPKASAQGQANNNAITGAINNNGSMNAPEVKVDITSLGAGLTQSVTAATATATAGVKSAGVLRSTTFDNFLIRQVSGKVAITFKNNIGKATLTLNPPELGRLKVEIAVKNNSVKATIATENVLVKDALESNLPLLREALQAQGLTVDEVSIMLDGGSQAYDDKSGEGLGRRNSAMNGSESESTEESAIELRVLDNDGLDIFI
ncbi:MAG: flagellar hook-length control protein FliK, partial [Thermodesulfobacteriota bacterium]